MVINKNVNFESLNSQEDASQIEITKDVVLNKEMLVKVLNLFPNSKITILSGYDQMQTYSSHECLYDEEEVKVLADNINFVRTNYNRDLLFDDMFTVEQAISASRKINFIVKEISSAELDGKPLSPYEKFLWAYQYVTDRVYNEESQNEDPSISRNLVSVLNGDKIVCVGYANMLTTILNRLGIPCTFQTVVAFDPTTGFYGNHATCCVRIDDDKYNKHGVYYSDPTADQKTANTLLLGFSSFNSSLITYKNLKTHFEHPIGIDHAISSFYKENNFKSAMDNSSEVPKILSYLFPEKTYGKTQDVLIQEKIDETIYNSQIQNFINSTIENITIDSAYNDYVNYGKNVLKVPMLVNMTRFGDFDSVIRSNINEMYAHGFSKEEILSSLKDAYTTDSISAYIVSNYKRQGWFDNPKLKSRLESDIEAVSKKLPSIDRIFNTFNFEKVKPVNPEQLLSKLSKNLTESCMDNYFFNENNEFKSPEIGALIRKGFSFEDIIQALKNQVSQINLRNIFIDRSPEDILRFAITNEKELYNSGFCKIYSNSDCVYNEPYEKDFEKLKESATPFTNKEIFQAFINIYMSQGKNREYAQQLASVALRNTYLSEPKRKD